jgi:hypothetical protein
MLEKMASVSESFLLRICPNHLSQTVAVSVQNLCQSAWQGQLILPETLAAQLLKLLPQSSVYMTAMSERLDLAGYALELMSTGLCHLWMLFFPKFVTAIRAIASLQQMIPVRCSFSPN